ncbi:unnamed protein product [Lactuca saligna]|uniref:Uncharacterized protein n=1 Tax=Lactuca saligna TaxID=75948 RepID=A0AA35ZFP7_LACSI|nr:unnamed protein product [Lactuca saligna]
MGFLYILWSCMWIGRDDLHLKLISLIGAKYNGAGIFLFDHSAGPRKLEGGFSLCASWFVFVKEQLMDEACSSISLIMFVVCQTPWSSPLMTILLALSILVCFQLLGFVERSNTWLTFAVRLLCLCRLFWFQILWFKHFDDHSSLVCWVPKYHGPGILMAIFLVQESLYVDWAFVLPWWLFHESFL